MHFDPHEDTKLGLLDPNGNKQYIDRKSESGQQPEADTERGSDLQYMDGSGPGPNDTDGLADPPGIRRLYSSKKEKNFIHFGRDGKDSPILFVVGAERVQWAVGDAFTKENSCEYWKKLKSQVIHTKGFWKDGSAGAIFGAHLGAFFRRC
ncbi:hypothetical protein ADK76_08210 [Streptomyces griseoflavus]|nr:hypothetical protein ADK76_08210 [Streptomyces griseoflavus]